MRRALTDLQKLRLAIDYENGFQSGVLARHYGVSDTTVRNVLREYGIVPTGNNSKLSMEVELQIVALYESGLSTRNIGDHLGIVNSTVTKVLRRQNTKTREFSHPHVLSGEHRLDAVIQYESGKTLREVSGAFQCSKSTVKKALEEFGIPSRTGWGKFKTEPWDDYKGKTHVFKSRWELSYAQYLDDRGLDWEYEPRKFILDGYIYTPDFRVCVDRGIEYHEVKGWLDERTIRRLKAFVSKYPEETLRIIGPAEMVALGLAEEYYLKHKMADEVSSLRHQIEGDNHGQNNC